MRKVLVLEDEDNIRSFVVLNLNRAGYDTLEATTGEEALEILREHPETRIALLDVNLPGIDGFEVCRRIRATNSKMGIIMLTARTLEMDKVTGLMTGADDYVTKPFSPAELTARQRRDLPAPLPAQHPKPDAGEEWQAHQADPGGILGHQAVYGQPRQSPVSG